MRIECAASLAELSRTDWDALSLDSPLQSYGWLRLREIADGGPRGRLYLLARDEQGPAVAIAADVFDPENSRALIPLALGRLRPLRVAFASGRHPTLIADTCLTRRGATPEEACRLLNAALDAWEETAAERRWSVAFRRLPEELPGRHVFVERGYAVSNDCPTAHLEIDEEWAGFPDYLRYLRLSHRKTADGCRYEVNRGKRRGLSLIVGRRADSPAAWHPLLESHFQRRNGKTTPYSRALLERFHEELGGQGFLFMGRVDGTPAGCCLGIRSGAVAAMPVVGVDHGVGRDAAIFPNLCFNTPIDHWIQQGVRWINYGTLNYPMKIRRGCRIRRTFFYVKPRGLLERAIWPLHAKRIQQRYRTAFTHAEEQAA